MWAELCGQRVIAGLRGVCLPWGRTAGVIDTDLGALVLGWWVHTAWGPG